MFTIIGGDGREYGPATVEQIRSWLSSGRANLETQARRDGTGEWHRLGDFPEFGSPAGEPPVIPDLPPVTSTGSWPAPVTSTPAQLPLASRGVRFAAALIDGVLKWACWLPTSMAVVTFAREQIASGGDLSPDRVMEVFMHAIGRSLPLLLVLAIVQGVLLTLRGQSIGKLLCKIRIVRKDTEGTPGFVRAFLLRGTVPLLIEQVPLLGGLFWIVDACFIFGDERRCVHDYIAGTKVVPA